MLCFAGGEEWSGGPAGGVANDAGRRDGADADGPVCDGAEFFDALRSAGSGGRVGIFTLYGPDARTACPGDGALRWSDDAGRGGPSVDGSGCGGVFAGAGLPFVGQPPSADVGNSRIMRDCSGPCRDVVEVESPGEHPLSTGGGDAVLLVFKRVAMVRIGRVGCAFADSGGGRVWEAA